MEQADDIHLVVAEDGDNARSPATPSIRADGTVLYDGCYDGRIGVLNPSPGHVIVTKTGDTIHHDPDCQFLRRSHRADWVTYQDPGGSLWREVLLVGPIDDEKARARFARARGLENGKGDPILWVCQVCVVRVPPKRAR
ncbi:hypothetical protein GCM10009609_19330 [Pseudonocardia aurantiaca]|uniref:Pyridoxamine 5'-phosphate oxidase putative domain-containing protein n=1 Tax=Pseudonocardia aurantiaca TaxID=75290 RepID=A0ABW4FQK9_9PSEU